jgi:hypothetical protein
MNGPIENTINRLDLALKNKEKIRDVGYFVGRILLSTQNHAPTTMYKTKAREASSGETASSS